MSYSFMYRYRNGKLLIWSCTMHIVHRMFYITLRYLKNNCIHCFAEQKRKNVYQLSKQQSCFFVIMFMYFFRFYFIICLPFGLHLSMRRSWLVNLRQSTVWPYGGTFVHVRGGACYPQQLKTCLALSQSTWIGAASFD
jgi:hypothetical protein